MTLYWILMLTMNLLPCLAAPINFSRIFKDVNISITILQKANCNELDSTFYIPSSTSGCIRESLQCSLLELEVVASECFENGTTQFQHVHRAKANIEHLLNETVKEKPNFQHCFCETDKKNEMPTELLDKKLYKPYKEFIENLKKLMQMLNSSWSSQREHKQ